MKLLQLLLCVGVFSCCGHTNSLPLRKGDKVLNKCMAAKTGKEVSVCCLYVSAGHTQCHITCTGVDSGRLHEEDFACGKYKQGDNSLTL